MKAAKGYDGSTECTVLPGAHGRPVPKNLNFLMEHLNDPNYDLVKEYRSSWSSSLELPTKEAPIPLKVGVELQFDSDEYTIFNDESPYPEVRAAVSTVDDPLMPVNTFRMWFLGLLFLILVSGLNQVLSMRYPSVLITGVVTQLLVLPFGKGLEKILPATRFNTFGYVWSFNPGPFSVKEHVCITVMSNVVVGGAYATDVILAQRVFYGQKTTWTYQMLVILSTQIIGFSIGGTLRQFIVWPSSMIWPGALVNSALFNMLHKNFGTRDHGHISRERFFLLALACSFFWYWIPGYLFTGLSVFNWVCWIAPDNIVANILFGTNTGLGMGILTLDWSMIAYIGSPLVTPWWSAMNTVASFIVVFWIVAPIVYFTNTWYTAFLPISAYVSFDRTGVPYNSTAIVTDGLFDQEKYSGYSPLFMPATLCLSYGVAFASFASVLVHTFLWFRRDIVRRFRSSSWDERDVHSRLMRNYSEVPMWWYGTVGIVCLIMLLVSTRVFPTQLPAWAALIAFVLSAVLALPVGMLQAITNRQVPTQVIHELIAGYMIPGRPIANMLFKCTAFIGTAQAVTFAGGLKLGHYMKIPPRVMFAVQLVAAIVSCFVVNIVQDWMLANIEDICTPEQKDGFTCSSSTTFATASLIWGGIGPSRLFSPGAQYNALLWFFAIGALAPIPLYFLARRFPLSIWRYINIPVCFAGLSSMPPASGINYASWAIVGLIFNYFIRRSHLKWWMRYNYILSVALDAGVVISSIVVFFSIQYPKGSFEIRWWGNTVWQNTADAKGVSLHVLGPDETLGPAKWS